MANHVAADETTLRLAFGGFHPDRLRVLSDEFGRHGLLRRIEAGAVDVAPAVRSAVCVPATDRTAELSALGVSMATPGDGIYPAHLADLPDAPPALFVKGGIPSLPAVAVVGTRRCTRYGRDLAHEYGVAIAGSGWSLVSGLARGIDGAAHRGTLDARGVGVAVLGCGIDVDYPREHVHLARSLVQSGGGVISEYPPGTAPEPWRFPPRNRIISGMVQAVVVVEATATGGALITARYAMEHGRAVFVVPGDVRRASSEGCNRLIRDGAHPVFDPADLVEELSLVVGPPSAVLNDAVEFGTIP